MSAIDEVRAAQLWSEYHATKRGAEGPAAERLRDELVITYAPLVSYVVGRLSVRIPSVIERADLVQWGSIGLISAVERFVPGTARFEGYALTRIRGAVIDGMRAIDFLPRSARGRAREIEGCVGALTQRLQRAPTDAEAAEACGMDVDDYRTLCDHLAQSMGSLDALLAGADEDRRTALVETLTDADEGGSPERIALRRALEGEVARAIARLPEREQQLLGLYYSESLTQAEIARVLGVTEGRVSQLHTRAMLLLRGALANGRIAVAA